MTSIHITHSHSHSHSRYSSQMAWDIQKDNNVVLVTMNTNKMNFQNEQFFQDLDHAFDLLDK